MKPAIGVFDSGLGGVSVLRDIRHRMPRENLVYVADSAYAPYGDKGPDEVLQRSLAISEFLLEQGAKAIVVACNTATAVAVGELRERISVPIIGMEPGVKPALERSQTGRIGILATTRTLQSEKFTNLLKRLDGRGEIYPQACPGLVEVVESASWDQPDSQALLYHYINPLLDKGIDQLVLGCTHYPFLRAQIEAMVGNQVNVIDTGKAVARQVQRQLEIAGVVCSEEVEPEVDFFSSGELGRAADRLSHLWGKPVKVKALPRL